MASKGLTCSGGASAVVAHKAAANPSNLSSRFLPRSISFLSSSPVGPKTPSSRANSMVVKAQLEISESGHLYSPNLWLNKPILIDSPPYLRAPWGHTMTEKEIVMSFDMPGVSASDLEVVILGDELSIMFKGPKDKIDALGRGIATFFDTKVQLPPNCVREKAYAEFTNGILYVTIPRMTVDRTEPIYVPVRAVV